MDKASGKNIDPVKVLQLAFPTTFSGMFDLLAVLEHTGQAMDERAL